MKVSTEIELGKTYRDKVTGFKGIATGFVVYISGCKQILLAPKSGTDGSFIESQWFDEVRLEEITTITQVVLEIAKKGFDKSAAKR